MKILVPKMYHIAIGPLKVYKALSQCNIAKLYIDLILLTASFGLIGYVFL